MRRGAMLAALIAVAAAGGSLTSGSDTPQPTLSRLPPARSAALVRMPAWGGLACGSLPGLSSGCPQTLPRGGTGYTELWLVRPTARMPVAEFMLARGAAGGGADPPPLRAQVTVVAGPAGAALRLLGERRPRQAELRTTNAAGQRDRAESFGAYEWGGHRGALELTRSVSGIGVANLLTFSWARDGRAVVVGVSAWDPLPAAAATLRAIVTHGLGAPAPPSATPGGANVAGVPMMSTPPWLAALCRAQLGRDPCPVAMPRPVASIALVQVSRSATGREIDAGFGGEAGNPRRDRPPFLVHLTMSDENSPAVPATAHPQSIDLLGHGYPSRPVYLGAPVWGGHRGTLSLGAGLCFGNHLCYRWTQDRHSYLVSMHAGYPLSQSEAVFRAVISSTSN